MALCYSGLPVGCPIWEFQHTLSECLVLGRDVRYTDLNPCADSMVVLSDGGPQGDVWTDNSLSSHFLDGTVHQNGHVQLGLLPKSISSPWHVNFHLTVLLEMPTALVLLQWMGFGGWGWLNSSNVHQNILTFCPHKNNAPNSASAADPATNFRSSHILKIVPLR